MIRLCAEVSTCRIINILSACVYVHPWVGSNEGQEYNRPDGVYTHFKVLVTLLDEPKGKSAKGLWSQSQRAQLHSRF